jgi:hypothetical protein
MLLMLRPLYVFCSFALLLGNSFVTAIQIGAPSNQAIAQQILTPQDGEGILAYDLTQDRASTTTQALPPRSLCTP